MAITDVVVVNITIADASPSIASFGRPLILASGAPYVGGRQYNLSPSGLASMVTDGFATGDRAYQIASTMASQNPGTTDVIVYARTAVNAQTMDLTPITTTENFIYKFDVVVQGVTTAISYTVPGAATVASVVTGIHALVNAVTGVTATDDTTHVTITPTTAGELVMLDGVGVQGSATLKDNSPDGTGSDLATAAADTTLDWFGVVLDSFSEAEINATGAFAEANAKIFGAQSGDSEVWSASATDVLSDLQGSTFHFSYLVPSRDMSGNGAAALMARQFSRAPGSSQWGYQTLSGPTADGWTGSEFNFLNGKNALSYVSTNSVSHTYGSGGVGRSASGRDLSVTRGSEWLKSNIEVSILTAFLNAEKIPYNSVGIAQIETLLRAELNRAFTAGLINADYTVTVPTAASISAGVKASGVLPDVTFHANLQGAIGKVAPLDGTLSF